VQRLHQLKKAAAVAVEVSGDGGRVTTAAALLLQLPFLLTPLKLLTLAWQMLSQRTRVTDGQTDGR